MCWDIVQCCQIWELIFYKFELGYNIMVAIKNICCVKGEVAVDHSTVTRWFKRFFSGCKNLDNQAKSGRPRTILQGIETNSVSHTQRVSSKLGISQSSVVHLLHDLTKEPKASRLYVTLPKCFKTVHILVYTYISIHKTRPLA